MHELKIDELKYAFRGCRRAFWWVCADAIMGEARWFDEASNNLYALTQLPLRLIFTLDLYHAYLEQVRAENPLGSQNPKYFSIPVPDRMDDYDTYARMIRGAAANLTRRQLESTKSTGTPIPFFGAVNEKADLFIGSYHGGHAGGLQFLSGICIHAWSIFETMAGRLWVSALDSDPVNLGRVAAAYSAKEMEETEDEYLSAESGNKKDKSIRVPLNALIDCNWNLSGKLGTYSRPKFSFQKFDKIKVAYAEVWGGEYSATIDEVFSRSLRDVSLLRNVLVHKNGHIDAEFTRQRDPKGIFSTFPDRGLVPLTGTIVSQVIRTMNEKAIKLLLMVDRSISPNDYQI